MKTALHGGLLRAALERGRKFRVRAVHLDRSLAQGSECAHGFFGADACASKAMTMISRKERFAFSQSVLLRYAKSMVASTLVGT
jgi:hypothetical protein